VIDLYGRREVLLLPKVQQVAKGDIILITFPFTDLSGSKLRPAVILADTNEDVTVTFITTQLKWQEPTDVSLTPTLNVGAKLPSLIRTSKIATLGKTLIKGRIGKLTIDELKNLDAQLKLILKLP
jgi:mRNA interferase MazF